jgi:hypothetical protein
MFRVSSFGSRVGIGGQRGQKAMFGRRGSTALPGWRIFGHRLSPVRGIGKGSGFGSGVSGSGGNWRRDAALYGRRDARRYRAAGGGRQRRIANFRI